MTVGVSVGQWYKSSYSATVNDCVETALVPGGWAVRDSKLGDASPVLVVDSGSWASLMGAVRSGAIG